MKPDLARRRCLRIGMATVASTGLGTAWSQGASIVRIVVPFPAGNPLDATARALAEALHQTTSRNYIVDNKPGAAGLIGTAEVTRARPDGSTLLFTTGGHLTNAVLHAKIPYDVSRDFTPITQLLVSPGFALLVRSDSRFKTVADLVSEAKRKPGTVSYGSWGTGNTTHLIGALFARAAGIDLLHVPYKGSPLQDFLGGHVDLTWFSTLLCLQMIQEGKARALAISHPRRTPELPDVPTLAETGFREVELPAWSGLYGPPGMTPALTRAIHAEVVTASRQPDYVKLVKQAGDITNLPPEQFAALNGDELQRYRRDLVPLGIRIE